MLLRDFSSFDIMLLHFKLQTCFVLPGLISAIMAADFPIKIITYLICLQIEAVHHSPNVGKNLADHLYLPVYVHLQKPVSINADKMLRPANLWKYFTKKTGEC